MPCGVKRKGKPGDIVPKEEDHRGAKEAKASFVLDSNLGKPERTPEGRHRVGRPRRGPWGETSPVLVDRKTALA